MNRVLITRLLISTIILFGIFIGYKIIQKLRDKERVESGQQELSLDSLEFLNNFSQRTAVPKVLSLFHPSCDFCQRDAEEFRNASQKMKEIDILWISYDEKESIEKFSQTYGLDSIPNMHFACMNIEAMLGHYGNVKFPTFLAYNAKGQLLKKFVGLTTPQEILQTYKESDH